MEKKEAMKILKDLHDSSALFSVRTALDTIIPELKESEDEKIRKWLIELVEEVRKANPTNADHNGDCSEAIAWLEKQGEQKAICRNNYTTIDGDLNNYCCKIYNALHKENGGKLSFARLQNMAMDIYQWCNEQKQGEQKPADKVEPKFKVKYAGDEYNVFYVKDFAGITYYGIEDEPNHIDYIKAENCEIVSEQKPAWSARDERAIRCLEYTVKQFYKGEDTFKWWCDWFKSIKDRVQQQPKQVWKPSDEQMDALERCVEYLDESDNEDYVIMESLYQDLKKLREE